MVERIDSYEKGGESKEKKNLSFDIKKALKELRKQVDRENSGSTSSKRVESSVRQGTMIDRQRRALGFPEYDENIPAIDCNAEFDKLNIDFRTLGHVKKNRTLNGMGERIEQTEFVFDTSLEKTDENGNKYIELNGTRFDYVDFDRVNDIKVSNGEVKYIYTKRKRRALGRDQHYEVVCAIKGVDVKENGKIKHKTITSGIIMMGSKVDRVRDELRRDVEGNCHTVTRTPRNILWQQNTEYI